MDQKIPNADGSLFRSDGKFATGVEAIDRQHDEIFSLIEVAGELIGMRAGADEIRQLFEQLLRLCKEHFALEESLMLRHGYPQYEKHRAAHDALLREGSRLMESEAPDGSAPHKLLDLFRGWSLIHVFSDDQALGAFLAGRQG